LPETDSVIVLETARETAFVALAEKMMASVLVPVYQQQGPENVLVLV
jgi:hypothetical protein